MTTPEHAMLMVNAVLATGLTRRHGWQIAAIAGIAAILPDWDGLTLLWSAALFDTAHRCWGHGLFSCVLLAAIVTWFDARHDLTTRLARGFLRLTRITLPNADTLLRPHPAQNRAEWGVRAGVILAATLSHPLTDLLVSGADGLNDWKIDLFWPFSHEGFVFPLLRWGDIGVTLIFTVGAATMLCRKRQIRTIAAITLATSAGYAILRAVLR